MEHAASFFRTPLLAASLLPFFCALSGTAGLVEPPPLEGSPAYLAARHVRDAFSTEVDIDMTDVEEALATIQKTNQILAPTFSF